MMHGLVESILELRRIFGNADVAWRREQSLLHQLAPCDTVEGLEASSLELLRGVVDQLLLLVRSSSVTGMMLLASRPDPSTALLSLLADLTSTILM